MNMLWRVYHDVQRVVFVENVCVVHVCLSTAPQCSVWIEVLCNKYGIRNVPEKRKPINQVNFSDNCYHLSEKVYIVTKFSLSSFF